MKNIILLLFMTLTASCSCFTFDGKAKSFCEAKPVFENLCKDKGGVLTYNPIYGTCKDGTEVRNHKH